APYISPETLEIHYGNHHTAYVDKLNGLIPGTEFEKMSVEEIVKRSQKGPVFNNAAQVWNHSFYWNCLKPQGGGEPTGKLLEAINKTFGSFAQFKDKFSTAAAGQFGSGWAWLIKDETGNLAIETTPNAETPFA